MAKDYVEAKIKADYNHAVSVINLSTGKDEWLFDDGTTIFMVASPELLDYAGMYNYILLDHRTHIVFMVQSIDLDFDLEGEEA